MAHTADHRRSRRRQATHAGARGILLGVAGLSALIGSQLSVLALGVVLVTYLLVSFALADPDRTGG